MPGQSDELRSQAEKSRALAQGAFVTTDKASLMKLAEEFDRRADELEAADAGPPPTDTPPTLEPRPTWQGWFLLIVGLVAFTVVLGVLLAIIGWIIGAVLTVLAVAYAWLKGARKDG